MTAFMGVILLLFPVFGQAQVPVSLAPSVHNQFLDATGKVLAGGFIYTYQAGTTTRQDTYTDSTGTIINAWPIPLDATGAPSNLTTQTGIWLSNQAYKFCGYNSALVQQWCTDNVNAYQIINGVQNITLGPVTSDPTGAAGELGYRSDLGCFRGYTTFWDCFVRLTDIQTLTNKTLTSPIITNPAVTSGTFTNPTVNAVQIVNTPATYVTFPNNPIPGTTNGNLMKLTGNPSAITAPANTDTGGVIGILVTGQGGGGTNGTVQQTGTANCNFDGATTAGDYVQLSPTTGGQCHDAGATYPAVGQVVGRVLTTNAVAGLYAVNLFSPETKGGQVGAATGCTTIGPVTITNNNAQQTLLSCTIPANTLSAGSLLNVDITGLESTASGQTITLTFSLGGGTPCSTTTNGTLGVANNQPFNGVGKFAVLTAGVGGSANWSCSSFWILGAVAGNNGVVGAPTISVNTTVPNTLLIQAQMSVANAGNSITAQLLKAVIY